MFDTSNKARMVKFYQEKLGFVLNNPNDTGIYMMHLPSGSPTIGFSERTNQNITNHHIEVTFLCDSRVETVAALKKKGIKFTNEKNNVAPGMFVANFNDPDGNPLAILAFKE